VGRGSFDILRTGRRTSLSAGHPLAAPRSVAGAMVAFRPVDGPSTSGNPLRPPSTCALATKLACRIDDWQGMEKSRSDSSAAPAAEPSGEVELFGRC